MSRHPNPYRRYEKRLGKSRIARLIAALLGVSVTSTAYANDNHLLPDAYVHDVSLNLSASGEIVATPQSGNEFSPVSLEFDNVYVEGEVRAKTGWGRIRTTYLFVGTCGSLCGIGSNNGFKNIGVSKLHRPGKWEIRDRIAAHVKSDAFSHSILSANDSYSLITNACKQAHQGNVSNIDRTTTVFLPFSVIIDTHRPFQGYGASFTSGYTQSFGVRLRCKAPVRPDIETPDELIAGQGDMSVSDLRVSLRTFTGEVTRPTPGRECKRAKLKVSVKTNQSGPVRLKLSEQRNSGAITNRSVVLEARHQDGRFLAVHEEWVETSQSMTYKVSAKEVADTTFPESTPWKHIRLRCEGVAGGGFQSPNNG